jgi:magnesium-transporting ATPase (P-type)
VRSSGNEGHLYTKGASEIIAEMCNSYMANDGTTQTIDAQMREEIMAQITTMASAGLRTISIAYCPVSNLEATKGLEDAPGPDVAMIFIGIVGIRDPPRKVSAVPISAVYFFQQQISWCSILSLHAAKTLFRTDGC